MIPERDTVESASQARADRGWIWAALALQLAGYVVDVLWHALVGPGREPTTAAGMVRHLGTVHAPLYVGALCVLISVVRALAHHVKRSSGYQATRPAVGVALTVALFGAVLTVGSEAWHAYSHLHLDTHTAPIAGILSVVGFVIVVAATPLAGRSDRRRGPDSLSNRRAA